MFHIFCCLKQGLMQMNLCQRESTFTIMSLTSILQHALYIQLSERIIDGECRGAIEHLGITGSLPGDSNYFCSKADLADLENRPCLALFCNPCNWRIHLSRFWPIQKFLLSQLSGLYLHGINSLTLTREA